MANSKDMGDIVGEYNSCMVDFKKFRDSKIEELINTRNLIWHPELKENQYLKHIEKEIQLYLNSMSRMIRALSESPKYVANFGTLETNCFVLEFHMVVLFEAFRRWLLKSVISIVYQNIKDFRDHTRQFEDIFKKLDHNFKPDFSSDDPISSLINKSYKRFIKKKVNLQPKYIISDQVLLEFFQEGYPINYNSSTFFCKKHYLCTAQSKESKNSQVIMVIDVDLAHPVYRKPHLPQIRPEDV